MIFSSFVIDALLHGEIEEVASLIVILRLWRIFKIVEEFTSAAKESMEDLEQRCEELEEENRRLKEELKEVKRKYGEHEE